MYPVRMRKSLVIFVAVALLGILAAYVKSAGGSEPVRATYGTSGATANVATGAANSSVSNTATSEGQSSAGIANTPASSSSPAGTSTAGLKDGTYQGADVRNRYGDVQVSVAISGGKITAVTFDQLGANDQHSQQINSYALPLLVRQTITAQNANIAGVSGATYTSDSYMQSLQSALDKAQA